MKTPPMSLPVASQNNLDSDGADIGVAVMLYVHAKSFIGLRFL